MTITEKLIQELQIEVGLLKERVEGLRGETEPIAEMVRQIAVIEHRLDEIKKTSETWSGRGWTLLIVGVTCALSIVAGIVTSLVTGALHVNK